MRACMKHLAASRSSSGSDANTWLSSGWSTKRYQRKPSQFPDLVRVQYRRGSAGAGPGESKHACSLSAGGPRKLPSFLRVPPAAFARWEIPAA